jgi:hypothetical protein
VAGKIRRIHGKERASFSYVHLQANRYIYTKKGKILLSFFFSLYIPTSYVCVRAEGLKFCIGSFLVTWHCA